MRCLSPCCTSGHNQKNQPEPGWLTVKCELICLNHSLGCRETREEVPH